MMMCDEIHSINLCKREDEGGGTVWSVGEPLGRGMEAEKIE